MNILQGSQHGRIDHLVAYQVEGGLHQYALTINAEQKSLFDILQPITDASHARDRKRAPPDSACFPGTRLEVVTKVDAWASDGISTDIEPHICWMHGYVGCGKSAISQEVCDKSERQDRPVVSFFFFRNAGDRSKIWRLPTTLAYQMAVVIPETEPFIRSAVRANPALLRPDEAGVSLAARMQRLVYGPFKAAVQGGTMPKTLARGPLLIVLDGLDECDNKDEVQELIDDMLVFFDGNPFIPLRVFITSRVEQHIQSRLNVPGVHLDNLVDHCSDKDITAFLDVLFQDAGRRNPVIQAYVREHGEWPTPSEKRKLVGHIGGSFIFASAVFKFVMGSNASSNHPTTPIDRLPLALKMNPGLDGLYAQTLALSEHLAHFLDIISIIALLQEPLPTSGIAELLGIHTYEVVNVLVNLQAIIQVPGTDDTPVALCHTSLRDFLTTQTRSGRFFAHARHHVHLFFRCLERQLELRRRRPGVPIYPSECTHAGAYALKYPMSHLALGKGLFQQSEFNTAIQLCREALALSQGTPEPTDALPNAITRATQDRAEAISLDCVAPKSQPSPRPTPSYSLNNLGTALLWRYRCMGTITDLEEAISLYRNALELRPPPHPDRLQSLNNLANALMDRHRIGTATDSLEEAVSLYREALELQPSSHPHRSSSLKNLGGALLGLYRRTGAMADLEEANSLFREALKIRPFPHPHRSDSLSYLSVSLQAMYGVSHALPHLQEAIHHCEELLEFHYPIGHRYRVVALNRLNSLLQTRFDATGQQEDLARIDMLKEEATCLSAPTSAN